MLFSVLVKCIHCTQKMKFFIKNFFSKCDQIRSFLRIWSHLLKKSFMENFMFCAVIFARIHYVQEKINESHYMRNTWVFPSISHSMRKSKQMGKCSPYMESEMVNIGVESRYYKVNMFYCP